MKDLYFKAFTFKDICEVLNIKLSLPTIIGDGIVNVVNKDKLTVDYIQLINNGFTSKYLLVVEDGVDHLIKLGKPDSAIPLFTINKLNSDINTMTNESYRIRLGSYNKPNIRVYNTFKVHSSNVQGYKLVAKQNISINEVTKTDYFSFDEETKRIFNRFSRYSYDYSKFIRTNKTIKNIKVGSMPEKYFYETSGGYSPWVANNEVSIKYRVKETLDLTEPWYNGDVHNVHSDAFPSTDAVIYKSVWDNNQGKYTDAYYADCVINKNKVDNLVDDTTQIGFSLFDIKCLQYKVDNEVLRFPVQYTPLSYKEYNFRQAEPLSELTLWLNKYLKAQLIENTYSSLEEFLKYNKENAEEFSRSKAEVALKMLANKLELKDIYWLNGDGFIAIYTANRNVIHSIRVKNTDVFYEDSYIK